MTLTTNRPKVREYTYREIIRLLRTRPDEQPLRDSPEFMDVGSPGGPVVPRGQIREARKPHR